MVRRRLVYLPRPRTGGYERVPLAPDAAVPTIRTADREAPRQTRMRCTIAEQLRQLVHPRGSQPDLSARPQRAQRPPCDSGVGAVLHGWRGMRPDDPDNPRGSS